LQVQIPAIHALPFWELQLLPHPPQLLLSVSTLVSQPSSVPVLDLLQFARPGIHDDVHALPAHTRPATFAVEQVRLHAPQFERSS
jgi:hypothetical protein